VEDQNRHKTQQLILEIKVTGDESDFARCEKMGEASLSFLRQLWWLADPRFEFACSVKVKTMPQQKTHTQVQLPSLNGNGKVPKNEKVKQPCAVK